MPLCQGRATRPGHVETCPDNRRDESVRNRQGDLFLCDACTDFRFPGTVDLSTAANSCRRRGKNKAPVTTSRSATTTTRSTTRRGPLKSDSLADDPGATTSRCDVQHHPSNSVFCPKCCEPAGENCIDCDTCCDTFHPLCTGLSAESYEVLLSIVSECGWVCADCRRNNSNTISKLKSSVSRTHEELADMHALMMQLKCEIDILKSQVSVQLPVSDNTVETEVKEIVDNPKDDKLSHHVTKIIHDMQQRKSNVVVSGLPEPPTDTTDPCSADIDTFTRLCEDHLSVKPSVVRHSCRWLGKPSADRPRKLLIRLHSESTAQSLLRAARELRTCDDVSVSAHVYINADLSPAEAKIAFEKRQRKRERTHASSGSSRPGNCDKHLNLDADLSASQHQLLGNTHCDADGSTLPTTNSLSTSYKDITGVINDEPIGVTVVSHNVDGSINLTPQATLLSTTPADTCVEQSFRNV